MTTASVLRVCARRRTWTSIQLLGLALVGAAALVAFLPGHASAQSSSGPAVTLSPAGPYADQTSVTITGTGFPSITADPSGLSIIECADAGGLTANLPVTDASCDGSTVNPLPINQDASGDFTATYNISSDSVSGGAGTINCDSQDYCVLWVGVDYVNAFQSNFAFSAPFLMTTPPTTTTTTTTTTPTTTTATTATSTTTTTTTAAGNSGTPTTTSTTTTTSPTTTTTGTGGTTTTTGTGATTTSIVGSTSTTSPPTGGNGAGAGNTGGSGATTTSAAGTVGASSGQLAFTGPPTVLPWLVGFGVLLLVLGTAGRRLVSSARP